MMKGRDRHLQSKALIWAAITLVSALLVVLVSQRVLELSGDLVLISLLVLPLIVYGVVSGVLEEFSAPGGWKASFRKEAETPALTGSILETVELIPKGMLHEISARIQAFPVSSNPVLVIQSPSDIQYTRPALHDYVETLSRHPGFRFVAFVDEAGRLRGHVSAWSMVVLLRDDASAADLIGSLGAGDPFVLIEPLPFPPSKEPTLLEALQMMDESGLDALLVVDQGLRIKGVVNRDVVLARLLIALGEE